MSAISREKNEFEKFLYRPNLVSSKKWERVGLVALDGLFGITTLGLVHLGFGIKHVFFDYSKKKQPSLLKRIEQLWSKNSYLPRTQNKDSQNTLWTQETAKQVVRSLKTYAVDTPPLSETDRA